MELREKYCEYLTTTVVLWTAGRSEEHQTAGFDLCKLQLNPNYKMSTESENLLKAEILLNEDGRIPFDMKKHGALSYTVVVSATAAIQRLCNT